jgi:hypothetical protein
MRIHIEWVGADQQVFGRGEQCRSYIRADADEALIGVHFDDGASPKPISGIADSFDRRCCRAF